MYFYPCIQCASILLASRRGAKVPNCRQHFILWFKYDFHRLKNNYILCFWILKNLSALKTNPYLASDLGSPICAGTKLSPGSLPQDRQYLRDSSAKSGGWFNKTGWKQRHSRCCKPKLCPLQYGTAISTTWTSALSIPGVWPSPQPGTVQGLHQADVTSLLLPKTGIFQVRVQGLHWAYCWAHPFSFLLHLGQGNWHLHLAGDWSNACSNEGTGKKH